MGASAHTVAGESGVHQRGWSLSVSVHLRRFGAVLVTAAVASVGTIGTATAVPPNDQHRPGLTAVDSDHQPARQDPTRASGPGVYIVTMVGKPAATYNGGIPGYPATSARPGERFDRTRPAVADYRQRLLDRQDRVLSRVGGPEVLYRFTTAVNGFAADLSSEQVKELRASDGVALVERSTKQKLDTVSSPGFLGLEQAWSQAGGPGDAGRGTVVGVIDSGIWPENPSFAGLPGRDRVPGFHGACRPGEQWAPADCNNKVISARYFVKGFGAQNTAKAEYLSPRDGGGHGSHTAATAAGNRDVAVQIEGQDFGTASGMAPAARIAAYKACWVAPNPDDDGCTTADTVAAIDQAVADGVDVINYSISGARGTLADSVELAFLNATGSGVFVAASAGNSGPDPTTVSHPSPWVTTVGASSHQQLQGSVALDDEEQSTFVGAMVSETAVPSTRIVLAADVAASGASAEEATICEIGSLDAELVQDNIVVCDRGITARVDKSVAVARAGGAGMVLANSAPDSVHADFHSVPTVHVDVAAGQAIKEYVRTEGEDATASIDPAGFDDTPVPQVAEFSSRGPSPASDGDILKPDLTAPGVGVVAAVAPPSNAGRLWDLYSGTSMSAPHIAGLAAFIQSARPEWSPAQVKSAMMTTAYTLEGHTGPFAQGAGHVDPTSFLEPGLVFGADVGDYLGFLAGQGFTYADGSPVSEKPIDASDLNLPSIAVGALTGSTTVTRRVTNVSGGTETYAAQLSGLGGIDATVRPQRLTVGPGETARFRVTFETEPDASMGTYAKGSLTWTGLEHQVQMPIVVKPELVDAPEEVTGEGSSGAITVGGVSGTDAGIALATSGLVSAMPIGVSLVPGPFDPAAPSDDDDTFRVPVQVPAGTEVARFEMNGHNSADDLDLFVYLDGELVAQSATASADETVTLFDPEVGEYAVYVSSYSAANGSTSSGQFYSWVVGQGDSGNLEVTPSAIDAAAGNRFAYRVSWDALDPYRWFGAIRYGNSDHRTLITLH